MPTVYKREGSPFYYFDVSVKGRRKRVSTKRTKKAEAVAVADSYRTQELDRIQHGQGVQELTLKQALFDHYLPTVKGCASYRDLERHCRKLVGEFPGVRGLSASLPFHEVTASMLRSYRLQRAAQKAAPQSIDHEIKVVSAAYHLVREDYRVRAGLSFPMERPKGKPRPLTTEEEAALLDDLDPKRSLGKTGSDYFVPASALVAHQRVDNYDLVVMLLDTGCRFGEIAGLTWDMVDTITWQWVHIYRRKVDNEAQLAMTDRMRDVLQRRHNERRNGPYVFNGWAEKGKEAPRQSTAAIRRAMTKIGVNAPHKVARYGRRDVRSLRDTFATKLRGLGMSIDRLQPLLGHSSPQMTMKYADLRVEQASTEAVSILNKLNGNT